MHPCDHMLQCLNKTNQFEDQNDEPKTNVPPPDRNIYAYIGDNGTVLTASL